MKNCGHNAAQSFTSSHDAATCGNQAAEPCHDFAHDAASPSEWFTFANMLWRNDCLP